MAARLPLAPGAGIELLHAVPEQLDTSAAERMAAQAKGLMEGTRQAATRALEVGGNKGRNIFTTVKHGMPFVEVAKSAHYSQAELIVIGRHGERTFRGLLIGSTAERVIRKGDVSVLVVARAPAGAYRRPLVAVDMSDSSQLALDLALRISDPAVKEVDVVHVVPPPSSVYVTAAAPVPDSERRLVEDEQRARTELTAFLERVKADVHWNVVLRTGDARQVILEEARTRGSDLIVLGTKGRTGLAYVLVGSVAEGVLRAASCDVLVARLPRANFNLS